MVVRVTPAYPEHISPLLENAREDDVREMQALGISMDDAIWQSINNSASSWTGYIDDQIVCIFGVARHKQHGVGMPWMFGSKLLDQHDIVFLRRCGKYVKSMLTFYPMLVNYVDCRNTSAVKWLKWLGFKFDSPIPYGINGEEFYPFWMTK